MLIVAQAVEVRGHAQQQREQIERLREQARQRQSTAQRMQRSAAALRRSLALSSHVAILQAQALADACTAMLVRPAISICDQRRVFASRQTGTGGSQVRALPTG